MKIDPFKELNPPTKDGYWINKKTKERFGGAYISSLLVPNLKRVEKGFLLQDFELRNSIGEKNI